MLIVFLQQEIDVFKDQSLHFPHDMRGNAAIPTKAHWIEPEFAFTFRTPNVDVGRLCALVRVKGETEIHLLGVPLAFIQGIAARTRRQVLFWSGR
jgi:hypothetical protein